jgi:hypothetical protein
MLHQVYAVKLIGGEIFSFEHKEEIVPAVGRNEIIQVFHCTFATITEITDEIK